MGRPFYRKKVLIRRYYHQPSDRCVDAGCKNRSWFDSNKLNILTLQHIFLIWATHERVGRKKGRTQNDMSPSIKSSSGFLKKDHGRPSPGGTHGTKVTDSECRASSPDLFSGLVQARPRLQVEIIIIIHPGRRVDAFIPAAFPMTNLKVYPCARPKLF